MTKILNKSPFLVWKTLLLGLYARPSQYVNALDESGFHDINETFLLCDPNFELCTQMEVVNIVRVTSRDLGLRDHATYGEIRDAAAKLGLKECPMEVGPALRIEHKDQPYSEIITVMTRPIHDLKCNSDMLMSVSTIHGKARFGLDLGHFTTESEPRSYFVFCL